MLRLSDAVLCADEQCDTISDATSETCPKCGNKGLLSLASVLNRSEIQRRPGYPWPTADEIAQKELERLYGLD
jgi:hypothetical protein